MLFFSEQINILYLWAVVPLIESHPPRQLNYSVQIRRSNCILHWIRNIAVTVLA